METLPRTKSQTPSPCPSAGIWIALACYYAIVIPHFDYVPLWDSMEALEEYLFLPRAHLSLDNLLFMHNGHPSLGYFWPFWIGQYLFPGQMLMIHIINLAIGSLALISFGKIAAATFQNLAGRWEIALLTIAFAIHPIFVAYTLNFSCDFGLLAYFLATLWMLQSGRLGWAAWTGLCLIFSKEPGIALYLLLVVFYLSGALRAYRWKELWPLALSLLALGLFCAYQMSHHRPIFPWMHNWMSDRSLWGTYFPNPFKIDFRMACLGPFIFEFQWFFTLIILAGLLHGLLASRPRGGPARGVRHRFGALQLPFRSLLFLLIGCLYLSSRFVVFTNQRYFINLYPLVLLTFFAALLQLGLSRQIRTVTLIGCGVMLFACNFGTLDPLSKKIAGTFSIGRHQLLSIGTIRPDFGDLNRDEMVYNLEHLNLAYLLDMAFKKIQPTDQTVLVLPDDAWWTLNRLDPVTRQRTESTAPSAIHPIRETPQGIVKSRDKPATLYYLALPYLRNPQALALLQPTYQVKESFTFTRNGYQLQVLEMTLRPTAPSP
jgi:hypothetical protein